LAEPAFAPLNQLDGVDFPNQALNEVGPEYDLDKNTERAEWTRQEGNSLTEESDTMAELPSFSLLGKVSDNIPQESGLWRVAHNVNAAFYDCKSYTSILNFALFVLFSCGCGPGAGHSGPLV
jgi:hypothetical protein